MGKKKQELEKKEAERKRKEEEERRKKEAERKRKEEERRRKKYLHACKIGDIDHIKTHGQFYRQYHYGMTGYQSLMLAVQNQRIKVVKYLLDNGGNVSLSLNTEGDNAFHAVVVGLITLDWRDRSLDNGTYRVIRESDERYIEDLLKLLLHHESFSLEAMNRINYTDHTPLDIILRAYLKEATYSMAKQLPNNHLRFEETTGGFHYSRFHIPFSRKAFLDNIILLLHSKGAKGNKYQAKLDKLLEAEKARKQKEEAERILKEEQTRREKRSRKFLVACKN